MATTVYRDPGRWAERYADQFARDPAQAEKFGLKQYHVYDSSDKHVGAAWLTEEEARLREQSGWGLSEGTERLLTPEEVKLRRQVRTARDIAAEDPIARKARAIAEEGIEEIDPGYYAEQADRFAEPIESVGDISRQAYRGWRDEGRRQYTSAIEQLGRMRTGEESVARAVAAQQQAQLARGIASQLATARTASPAVLRGAMYARGQGMADIGAQAAVAEAEERQRAVRDYINAVAGRSEMDIGQSGSAIRGQQAVANLLQAQAQMRTLADQQRMALVAASRGDTESAMKLIADREAQAAQLAAQAASQPGFWEQALALGGMVGGGALGFLAGGPAGAGAGAGAGYQLGRGMGQLG
jgi:hypothetical protein